LSLGLLEKKAQLSSLYHHHHRVLLRLEVSICFAYGIAQGG